MNVTRIRYLQLIMRQAQNLDMESFQSDSKGRNIYSTGNPVKSIDELHTCGNTACMGGYLAISPLFRAEGGEISDAGAPVYLGLENHHAVAAYLGIREGLAWGLVHGYVKNGDNQFQVEMYPVAFKEVRPEHVAIALEKILTGAVA